MSDQTMSIIAGITAALGFGGTLWKVFDVGYKTRKRYEDLGQRVESLEKRIATMEDKQEQSESKEIKHAMRAILEDRLLQSCKHHLSKGSISLEELRTLTRLRAGYEGLGGLPDILALCKRVEALDTTRDDVIPVDLRSVDINDYLVGDGVLIKK